MRPRPELQETEIETRDRLQWDRDSDRDQKVVSRPWDHNVPVTIHYEDAT